VTRGSESPARRGFTLLEILIAIALLGLIVGVFAYGSARLIQEGPGSADEEFTKALAAARRHAVENYVEVRLSFDREQGALVLSALPRNGTAEESAQVATFPLVEEEVLVEFVAGQGGPTELIAGVLVNTTTVSSVAFYPNGTCTDFQVQIRIGASVQQIDIDPWTCAPILEPSINQ
jgi:prepilin-type N-terminal cleavage/methylation domain-containing protein